MAEYALVLLTKSVADFLLHEARHIPELRVGVQSIQTKLKKLQGILKIAVSRQEEDIGIHDWVVETREVSYNIEDLLLVASSASPRKEGSIFRTFTRSLREGINLNVLEPKIKFIEEQINCLLSDPRLQNITTCQEGGPNPDFQRKLRKRRTFSLPNDDFVGLDEEVQELVAVLLNDDGDQIYHQVVSITGMGGIGKTMMAKKIYHHDVVRSHFNAFAWVFIPKQWEDEDVLQRTLIMLEPEKKEIEKMNIEELVQELSQVQTGKRCLIVLDDVWDMSIWDLLKHVFYKKQVKIKVLMTTRNKEIAQGNHMGIRSYLYEQRHLKENESWELFKEKANRGFVTSVQGSAEGQGSYSRSYDDDDDAESRAETFFSCGSDLEEEELTMTDTPYFEECNQDQRNQMHIESLGREMVAECRGFPLAIVVLGGLLMTKDTVDQWREVHQNLKSYLTRGISSSESVKVYEVLEQSYHDLPYELKPCFLHLGNFPEDFKISTRKLYQLWSAEGFIPEEDNHNGEDGSIMDISECYLRKLVQRHMVQAVEDEATGKFKYCRLHKFVREMCLKKGKEENFWTVPPKIALSHSLTATETSGRVKRRLSVIIDHDIGSHDPPKQENGGHVRSAIFFSKHRDRKNLQTALDFLCDESEVLRVLDLERFDFGEKLPKDIGNLVHLKYLSLRGSQIGTTLPPSISNLRYIQTLDLRVPFLAPLTIPDVIWKLNNLKHLYLPPNTTCEDKLQLATLTHLETLKNFDTRVSDCSDMCSLTNLRKLGAILVLKLKHLKKFTESLKSKNTHIRDSSFRIQYNFQSQEELTILKEVVSFTHIRKLDLVGSLHKLPDHRDFASTLNKLTLRNSELQEDPMTTLEKLPNLYSLILRKNAFQAKKIRSTQRGFPKLKTLELNELTTVEYWTIEEGAMPNLSYLKIDKCRNLKMLPEGLKCIPTLKELVIANMPIDFKNRIQKVEGEGGEDAHKVEHVASKLIMETNRFNGLQLRQQSSGSAYYGLLRSFSPALVPKTW